MSSGEQFVCQSTVLHNFRTVPYFPEGSGVSLHVARAMVFACFAAYYEYHRRNMTKHTDTDFTKIMLPILGLFLTLFIVLNTLVAIVAGIEYVEGMHHCGNKFGNFAIAFQTAVFHTMYEGIGVFLCRYGIGLGSMRSSLFIGMLWGIFSFLVFFIISSIICEGFELPAIDAYVYNTDGTENFARTNKLVFILFASYKGCLALFYVLIWLAPERYLYRRPAAYFYAKGNLAINIYWIISSAGFFISSKASSYQATLCTFTVISLIVLVFVQPYIICRTFVIDSNYWQGIMVTQDNPTAALLLQNDVDTATTLAEKIGSLDTVYLFKKQNVNVIHFAQLTIDYTKDFISGGYSRVYFGSLEKPKQDVAIKVIYAMELSPYEIQSLCEEAQLLHELKHPNIISCLGICVMPPALALVCEYCEYGSLYAVLHKHVDIKLFEDKLFVSSKRQSKGNMMRIFNSFDLMPLIYSIGDSISNTYSSLTGMSAGHSSGIASSRVSQYSGSVVNGMFAQGNAESSDNSRQLSAATDESNGRNSLSERSSFKNVGVRSESLLCPLYEKSKKNEIFASLTSEGEPSPIENGKTSRYVKGNISLQPIRKSKERTSDDAGVRVSAAENTGAGDGVDARLESQEYRLGRGVFVQNEHAGTATLGMQMSMELKLKMMRECTAAIAFMHSKNFVHCDVKSLNFLVTNDFTVKLGDMGDARPTALKVGHEPQSLPSRNWAAPELLGAGVNVREVYGTASDVYSLAIVLSELVTIRTPYDGHYDFFSPNEWRENIVKESFRPDLTGNNGVPDPILQIIRHGWKVNPIMRCTANEMLEIISRFTIETEEK